MWPSEEFYPSLDVKFLCFHSFLLHAVVIHKCPLVMGLKYLPLKIEDFLFYLEVIKKKKFGGKILVMSSCSSGYNDVPLVCSEYKPPCSSTYRLSLLFICCSPFPRQHHREGEREEEGRILSMDSP